MPKSERAEAVDLLCVGMSGEMDQGPAAMSDKARIQGPENSRSWGIGHSKGQRGDEIPQLMQGKDSVLYGGQGPRALGNPTYFTQSADSGANLTQKHVHRHTQK